MQNQIFQSSANLCTAKIKKYIHLYKHLVETCALILNSKIVFKKLLWLKLLILKNTLTKGGNKMSHILKSKPTPSSCRFV